MLKNLENLHLADNKLDNFQGLDELKNLKWLYLANNNIT